MIAHAGTSRPDLGPSSLTSDRLQTLCVVQALIDDPELDILATRPMLVTKSMSSIALLDRSQLTLYLDVEVGKSMSCQMYRRRMAGQ